MSSESKLNFIHGVFNVPKVCVKGLGGILPRFRDNSRVTTARQPQTNDCNQTALIPAASPNHALCWNMRILSAEAHLYETGA